MLAPSLAFAGALADLLVATALARPNERRAHADRLLAEAVNDLVGATVLALAGTGQGVTATRVTGETAPSRCCS